MLPPPRKPYHTAPPCTPQQSQWIVASLCHAKRQTKQYTPTRASSSPPRSHALLEHPLAQHHRSYHLATQNGWGSHRAHQRKSPKSGIPNSVLTYRVILAVASHLSTTRKELLLQRPPLPDNLLSAQSQQARFSTLLCPPAPPNGAKESDTPCTKKSRTCANRTSTCRAMMSLLLLLRLSAACQRLR